MRGTNSSLARLAGPGLEQPTRSLPVHNTNDCKIQSKTKRGMWPEESSSGRRGTGNRARTKLKARVTNPQRPCTVCRRVTLQRRSEVDVGALVSNDSEASHSVSCSHTASLSALAFLYLATMAERPHAMVGFSPACSWAGGPGHTPTHVRLHTVCGPSALCPLPPFAPPPSSTPLPSMWGCGLREFGEAHRTIISTLFTTPIHACGTHAKHLEVRTGTRRPCTG